MTLAIRAASTVRFRASLVLPCLSLRTVARTSYLPNFHSSFSTLTEKIVCQCGATLPETDRIITLFKERNLRKLTQEVQCPYLTSFQFSETDDCEVVDTIEAISTKFLREFKDVISIGDSRIVLLESLHEIPEGDLGDLTGDHGKQLAKFLKDCLDRKLISDIGSVFDVGGQNTSTVLLVST